jgi:hypothetical protein
MLKGGLSIAKVGVTRSLLLEFSIVGNVRTECSERRNGLKLGKQERKKIKQCRVITEMGK